MTTAGTAQAQVTSVPVDSPPLLLSSDSWDGTPTVAEHPSNGSYAGVFTREDGIGWGMLGIEAVPTLDKSWLSPELHEPVNPDGSGRNVVYADYRLGYSDIVWAKYPDSPPNDRSTDLELTVLPSRTNVFDDFPAIAGSWIAWQSYDGSTGDTDIAFYNIDTQQHAYLPVSNDQTRPTVWEGKIAYEENGAIKMVDVTTNTFSTVVPAGSTKYYRPHMVGNVIAYDAITPATRQIEVRNFAYPAYPVAIAPSWCSGVQHPRVGGPNGDLVVFWGELCDPNNTGVQSHGIFIAKVGGPWGPAYYAVATWTPTDPPDVANNPPYDILNDRLVYSTDGVDIWLVDLDTSAM